MTFEAELKSSIVCRPNERAGITARNAIRLLSGLTLAFCLNFYQAASAEQIELKLEGSTYVLPVRINDQITLPFMLDTGATNVVIPEDVLTTLMRTGAIKEQDLLGIGTSVLADGSKVPARRLIINEIKVGNYVVKEVTANTTTSKGELLLGQSFLLKLPAWTLDNKRHALLLGNEAAPSEDVPADLAEILRNANAAFEQKNYVVAMRWYLVAASRGNAEAEKRIGWIYANGFGVRADWNESIRWYRRAAEKGNPEAESWMAGLYLFGRGVPQDYVQAARWTRLAAEKGDIVAVYNMGKAYEKGQGVKRDAAEAAKWYLKGAMLGDAESMNSIAMRYSSGEGVNKDCGLAKKWLEKAVVAGSWTAPLNIRYWNCK